MRAAALLIALIFAATVAARAAVHAAGGAAPSAAMNAAEQAVANAEAAADMSMAENESMDLGPGADMPMESNWTAPQAPRPAWLSEGFWLIAAEDPSGAIWYFEPFESDFTRLPFRVILRTDVSRVARRRHNNSERRIELDCAGRRYRILSTAHFDDAGGRTEANERGGGAMIRPAPGSIWAELIETVCRRDANQRGERNGNEVTFNGM